jgi:hypothetical protein
LPGRGFYQLEEEALYVPVAGYPDRARFFSYLESESVRFDLDLKGRLMMIEVNLPRRRWNVKEDISYPLRAQAADIRWLDFRQPLQTPKVYADPARLNLMLRFTNHEPAGSHFLAERILCQIDKESRLSAIWITDITDDLGGREIKRFRQATRSLKTG